MQATHKVDLSKGATINLALSLSQDCYALASDPILADLIPAQAKNNNNNAHARLAFFDIEKTISDFTSYMQILQGRLIAFTSDLKKFTDLPKECEFLQETYTHYCNLISLGLPDVFRTQLEQTIAKIVGLICEKVTIDFENFASSMEDNINHLQSLIRLEGRREYFRALQGAIQSFILDSLPHLTKVEEIDKIFTVEKMDEIFKAEKMKEICNVEKTNEVFKEVSLSTRPKPSARQPKLDLMYLAREILDEKAKNKEEALYLLFAGLQWLSEYYHLYNRREMTDFALFLLNKVKHFAAQEQAQMQQSYSSSFVRLFGFSKEIDVFYGKVTQMIHVIISGGDLSETLPKKRRDEMLLLALISPSF